MRDLDIKIQTSLIFTMLLVVLVLGSVLILGFLPLSQWNQLLLQLACMLSGTLIFIQHSAFGRRVTRIVVNEQGWRMGTESLKSVNILGESTVTRWVCIIRYKREQAWFKQTCIVFRDCLKKDQYRRLIVALRYLERN